MKKLLSFFLSAVMLILSVATFSSTALAANKKAVNKFDMQHKQYNAQNAEFNYYNNRFVYHRYMSDAQNSYIAQAKSIKKRGTKLAAMEDYTNIFVTEKFIYFADNTEGAIKRCRPNGTGVKKIVSYNPERFEAKFIINNKRLVYNLIQYNEKTREIISSNLFTCTVNGKKVKKIAKNVKTNFYTYKNKLYYVRNKDLYRYDFKEGKSKKINVGMPLKDAQVISMEGNILYLAFYKDKYELEIDFYAVDIAEFKYRKLEHVKVDIPVHQMLATNDKFYITTGTGGGNAFARVIGEKADYKTYRKKYTYLSENIGFYKNSIAVEDSDFDSPENNTYIILFKNK